MMSVVRGFERVLWMAVTVWLRGKECCCTFCELMSSSITAPETTHYDEIDIKLGSNSKLSQWM